MTDATREPSAEATASIRSAAITRYVVYLPPAIVVSPGAGDSTTCLRLMRVVSERAASATSGRSPAVTPWTSSRRSGSASSAFVFASR